jgi:hypothetical protein
VLRAEAIWATNANARTQAYINSVT